MQLPSILQGESLTRLLQGAAAGAVATMFVGFYWGGWSLGSTADKMAKERSDLARGTRPIKRSAGNFLRLLYTCGQALFLTHNIAPGINCFRDM